MAGLVQSYFSGEVLAGIPTLDYFTETTPLGTAGPVKAIGISGENVLAMNGDILSTLNLRDMWEFHRESGATLTLAVRQANFQLPLGVIEFDEDGTVTDFREKPTVSHFDNVGIYVYNRRALDFIPAGTRCDVNVLVHDLIRAGEKVAAFRSEEPYYWIDIGQHGDFERANEEFGRITEAFPFLLSGSTTNLSGGQQ